MKRTSSGFTIIELIVSLSILAVLATLILPIAEKTLVRQKESALKQALRDIRSALDAYRSAAEAGVVPTTSDSGYPTSLELLVEAKNERGQHFLRTIPRDPFSKDSSKPAASTWLYRPYLSAPDSPQAGADIFDVYSSSTEIGTNGVPYREW
ncbi:hypothetical protein D9M68_286920 [compost metagenome]